LPRPDDPTGGAHAQASRCRATVSHHIPLARSQELHGRVITVEAFGRQVGGHIRDGLSVLAHRTLEQTHAAIDVLDGLLLEVKRLFARRRLQELARLSQSGQRLDVVRTILRRLLRLPCRRLRLRARDRSSAQEQHRRSITP